MNAFLLTIVKIVSVFSATLMIPFSALTYTLDFIPGGDRNVEANVVGVGAYFRSQGIACDGENVYFSSKTTLIKTKSDCRTFVNMNLSAIPDELSEKYGIKHIGGISYYNGKIYAGMEDSKVWKYPVVGVFNADTLELENYCILDATEMVEGEEKLIVSRGLPWVAVDSETGYLYCTDHSKKPTRILSFDVNNDMAPVASVPLEQTIPSIQGGEFLNGTLFVATNDDTAAIYKINVENGTSEKYLDRNLLGGEGEGMTFIYNDSKPCILSMDMGTIFINSFVREYEVTQ